MHRTRNVPLVAPATPPSACTVLKNVLISWHRVHGTGSGVEWVIDGLEEYMLEQNLVARKAVY